MQKEIGKIAKYRKAEYPNEWFLTDFTMAQVEGRIKSLEHELIREIDHSRFLEKVLEALLGEQFDKITLFEASKLRHAILLNQSRERVYRAAVDQLTDSMAAVGTSCTTCGKRGKCFFYVDLYGPIRSDGWQGHWLCQECSAEFIIGKPEEER